MSVFGAFLFVCELLLGEAVLIFAVYFWWQWRKKRALALIRTPQAVADHLVAKIDATGYQKYMASLPRDELAGVLSDGYRKVWQMWEEEAKSALAEPNDQRHLEASRLAYYAKEVYERSLAFYSRWELKP